MPAKEVNQTEDDGWGDCLDIKEGDIITYEEGIYRLEKVKGTGSVGALAVVPLSEEEKRKILNA